MNDSTRVDSVVIGAGVIGLTVARVLAMTGRQVAILEAEKHAGEHLSSRNSEVIHAGLYYPPGSLKAITCVRGNALLYEYCRKHHVAHRRCGKLIVAGENQRDRLQSLHDNARACGATGLTPVSRTQLYRTDPWLRASAALHSATSGIVDSHGLMAALLGDAEKHGAMPCLGHQVTRIRCQPWDFELDVTAGEEHFTLRTEQLVNAAGLGAVPLVQGMEGFPESRRPTQGFAKGNYFSLRGPSPARQLIYPLPERHGLGIHLTVDLNGRARFGPDVEWLDRPDYRVDPPRAARFEQAIRRYWPALPPDALQPDYAGVRPKLRVNDERHEDFLIQDADDHGLGGLINLLGIESPGLTAALALAEQVAARL